MHRHMARRLAIATGAVLVVLAAIVAFLQNR